MQSIDDGATATPPSWLSPAGSRLARYALAIAGPVGSAGAQFLLSLVLLRVLDQAAFGRFSFLLVGTQFGWGIWSALFCAPLPALLATSDAAGRRAVERALLATNLLAALGALALFLLIGVAVGETMAGAALFAGYATVSLLRWFARAHAYAQGGQVRTAASDLVYSAALLIGTAIVALRGHATFETAALALLIAAAIAMLPFGRAFLAAQFGRLPLAAIRDYRPVWRDHSRWSLFGVVTTEATANAHAYLVTLLLGASAFAPIAASALMIRPITVAMNALTDYERPQMARQIGARRIGDAIGSMRFFRLVLIAAWLATGAAILVFAGVAPRLIFPPRYHRATLALGLDLWMAVAAVRLLRIPDSVLLQAGGAFRPLALASGWSSLISVAAVLALVVTVGPLWSIGGIFAGEIIFALSIWRERRRWTLAAPSGDLPCPA